MMGRTDISLNIGAASAVLVWILNLAGRRWDIEVPIEVATAMPVIVGFIVAFFVPQTDDDVAAVMTNEAILKAQNNPTSPVDLSKIINDRMIMQAQIDPESPATMPHGETVETIATKLATDKLTPRNTVKKDNI